MGVAIGASHICLGVPTSDNVKPIVSFGNRKALFSESSEDIPESKKPFLRQPAADQQLCYSVAAKGIGIEAITHRSSGQNQSVVQLSSPYFLPVLSVSRTLSEAKESPYATLLGEAIEEGALPESSTKVLYSRGDENSESLLEKLVLFTPDIHITSRFLSDTIGAKQVKDRHFKLVSLFGRSLEIFLAPSESNQQAYLDDIGWVCLSFDVKSLDGTVETLRASGAIEIGSPFFFRTAHRAYRIIFARGPFGELYEFLETVKVFR